MIGGGRSVVSSSPAFSNDAKKLLVCTANTVSIFNTATGLRLTELEGHTAQVTSVIVEPPPTAASKLLCYCWTASLDGTIRYWDFSVPESLKRIDIRSPIFSMVIPVLLAQPPETNEKPTNLVAYLCIGNMKVHGSQHKSLSGKIQKYKLIQSRAVAGITLAETKKPGIITTSSSGKYIGIQEKCKFRIWGIPAKDSGQVVPKKITLHRTKHVTVLAFHPTERVVAAGDLTGRIAIWRDFGGRTFGMDGKSTNIGSIKNDDERPGVRGDDDADSCTTWHWHSSRVDVLFFSSDGAYLYSGGKEGVLVVWQLDTGKKKFLPRIGSPLLHYINSPDPSLSSISCADNRIHLLKMPSMEILKSIAGIKAPCSVPEIFKSSFNGHVFVHTTGIIAIRTENYCIQFYSLLDDCEISEVQVCERNHQPADEVTMVVTLLAFSLDGSVMSTVETRLPEGGVGGLVTLKFWACGSQGKDFCLSTVIYEPHRDAGISAIAFHPMRRTAVSSSYGGDFKIWVCHQDIQQKEKLQNSGWTCHSVGSYKNKPMTAAAFSTDGSVLAVAAETVITLWDPEKNVLVSVIGESLESIRTLSFVGKSEYLVSATQGSKLQVSVWSMSKLSLCWSYKLHTEAVACTMDSTSFAVLALSSKSSTSMESNESISQCIDGFIILFNAGDPVPVATWSAKKAKGGGLAFLHRTCLGVDVSDEKPGSTLLAYINGDHEYVLFDPYGKQAREHGIAQRGALAGLEETGQFGYASIYGELPEFNIKRNQSMLQSMLTSSVPSERPWETIFSGPSYNLPPLSKLCSAFLESLLERRDAIQQ